MADQMTELFSCAQLMTLQSWAVKLLSHKTVSFMMHATGVYVPAIRLATMNSIEIFVFFVLSFKF